MSAQRLVSLHNISKIYPNGVTALKNINLDVRAGETLTLLGPSGCGKSTILRLLEGLAQPSGGKIFWHDEQIKNNLGAVFQEATLMPWATVFDNVYLPLRLKGHSRINATAAVEESLENVGLGHFAKALPRELSGGMKMRCAIARALVTKPSLILMDEPFAALDEVTRFRLNDDLLRLKEKLKATIIFVTHSVFESVFISTRIVVMSKMQGAIVEDFQVDSTIQRDENFRLSPRFNELSRQASTALNHAMNLSPRELML
jgi:NitT/TauT family transport system ATP-binding protein